MSSKKRMSQNRTDVDSTKSRRRGLAGLFESIFRSFRNLTHLVIMTPLYVFASVVIGVALTPGLIVFRLTYMTTTDWPVIPRLISLGTCIAFTYFGYGLSLVFMLPALNSLFRLRLKPWRGPYYSLPSVPWYIHNGFTYLLRYTFLEFITPTPLNIFFYRGMGMKIGRGTVINTSAISDPSLIRLGEKVTIGGSVTIVGHYGQGGFLVLAPVEIGDRVTVGLRCIIMGGVKIGKEAKILPNSAVMPKTIIPAGEVWGGVPARKIDMPTAATADSKKSA
jgi:acetyltransferase-like isoleucine patch superfamily enzyme